MSQKSMDAYAAGGTCGAAQGISGLHLAFADGTYPEWIDQEAAREKTNPHILNDLSVQLETLKQMTPAQRMEHYNWIVRYYSRSNKNFESTSLRLYDCLGCTEDRIREGDYTSHSVAEHLLRRLEIYDANIIVPVLEQIKQTLVERFSETNILFLGRDFCSAYLYVVNTRVLSRSNLFLCNISRYVRDVALGGKTTELRLVLERIGLTKETLIEKGLLIADSCMQGKIPAVILKSLALPMSESERYAFLTQCHVRYLKSSRDKGMTVAEKAMATMDGKISDEELNKIVGKRLEKIEEFPISYPVEVESYVPRRHKLFEWRPKVALISMGIEVDEAGPRLIANEPQSTSETALSLLGLHGELELVKIACENEKNAVMPEQQVKKYNGRHVVSTALTEYRKAAPRPEGWYLQEIEQRLKEGGIEALRKWREIVDPDVGSVAVMRTKDLKLPYELVINGHVIYRFKDIIGEGRNIKAYLTPQETIVKVAKDAKYVRKNLLLAWAEPFVRASGIQVARVVGIHETGLYLEQERILGESLESLYGESDSVPSSIYIKVLRDFYAAKRLIREKGIWLDLKSANYHLQKDGLSEIVNVDYGPRLNETYYRYFQKDPGFVGNDDMGIRQELTDDEFLEKFFHHDVNKRKAVAKAAAALQEENQNDL